MELRKVGANPDISQLRDEWELFDLDTLVLLAPEYKISKFEKRCRSTDLPESLKFLNYDDLREDLQDILSHADQESEVLIRSLIQNLNDHIVEGKSFEFDDLSKIYASNHALLENAKKQFEERRNQVFRAIEGGIDRGSVEYICTSKSTYLQIFKDGWHDGSREVHYEIHLNPQRVSEGRTFLRIDVEHHSDKHKKAKIREKFRGLAHSELSSLRYIEAKNKNRMYRKKIDIANLNKVPAMIERLEEAGVANMLDEAIQES